MPREHRALHPVAAHHLVPAGQRTEQWEGVPRETTAFEVGDEPTLLRGQLTMKSGGANAKTFAV